MNGHPTFINIGVDYPDKSRFTVIIWGVDRAQFPHPPESMYDGVGVCVRGAVTDYQGVTEIQVREPNAIETID